MRLKGAFVYRGEWPTRRRRAPNPLPPTNFCQRQKLTPSRPMLYIYVVRGQKLLKILRIV